MKRVFVLLLLAVLGGLVPAKAQDIIYKINGEQVASKVLAIVGNEIRYKDYANQDGPTYIVPKSDVALIQYQNGSCETFTQAGTNTGAATEPQPVQPQTAQPQITTPSQMQQNPQTYSRSGNPNIYPGMKYREYKKYYSPHQYGSREPGDPVSPVACGIASYFVPGLGQMISGRIGAGTLFMAGACASYLATLYSVYVLVDDVDPRAAIGSLVFWMGALVAIDIWSICDAVRGAIITNLYWRDCYGTKYSLDLKPYIAPVPRFGVNSCAAGLTLAVSF